MCANGLRLGISKLSGGRKVDVHALDVGDSAVYYAVLFGDDDTEYAGHGYGATPEESVVDLLRCQRDGKSWA